MQKMTFEAWYKEADRICSKICGLGIDDLSDGPSRDAYEMGRTPASYVKSQLKENGW